MTGEAWQGEFSDSPCSDALPTVLAQNPFPCEKKPFTSTFFQAYGDDERFQASRPL